MSLRVGVFGIHTASATCADRPPILGDDPGNFWGVECAKEKAADGPVVIFMHQLPGNGIAFDSVERMLSTMIAAFEAGIISDHGDGFLETDYAKLRPLMQSMNPDSSKYWTENPHNPYGPPAN